MNVSLTPQLEAMVEQKVKPGHHPHATTPERQRPVPAAEFDAELTRPGAKNGAQRLAARGNAWPSLAVLLYNKRHADRRTARRG